jgi:hypothetical protein
MRLSSRQIARNGVGAHHPVAAPRHVLGLLVACALGAAACGAEPGALTGAVPAGSPNSASGTPVVEEGAPTRDVTLRWIPSSSSGVVRYDLSVGRRSSTYDTTVRIPVGQATRGNDGVYAYTVTLQSDVDHYLSLRAYDGRLLSSYSNEIVVPATSGSGVGGGGGAGAETTSDPTAAADASPSSLAGSGGGASAAVSGEVTAAPPAAPVDGEADAGTPNDTAADLAGALTSLDLDGHSEYLASEGPRPLGVTGALTLSMWLRPIVDYAPRRVVFEARAFEDPRVDRVTLSLIDGVDLELVARGAGGEIAYRALFEVAPAHDTWQNLVVVFDPTADLDPAVYLDLLPCTLLESEGSGTMLGLPDADWTLYLGGTSAPGDPGLVGRLGHTAIWAEAVSLFELSEIHARGHQIDLRLPVGTYASGETLVHYWRLGEYANPVGYDLGRSDAPIDLDDPAGGVDAADVVMDGPLAIDAGGPLP